MEPGGVELAMVGVVVESGWRRQQLHGRRGNEQFSEANRKAWVQQTRSGEQCRPFPAVSADSWVKFVAGNQQ